MSGQWALRFQRLSSRGTGILQSVSASPRHGAAVSTPGLDLGRIEPQPARNAYVAKGTGSWSPLDSSVIVALVVGSLAITMMAMRGISFWGDEAFSWGLVHLSTRNFIRYLWGPETNMTAYYLGLRAWLGLVTAMHLLPTELVARVPSIAAGSLSVGVLFRFARTYWRRSTALTGACLYGLNYVVLASTTELRSYGLQMLLVCLSWQLLLPMLTDPRHSQGRRWWAYTLVTSLSVYAHLFSVFVVIAQAVVVWMAYMAARTARPALANVVRRNSPRAGLWVVLLLIPIALAVCLFGHSTYVPPAGIHALAGTVWNFGGRSVPYTLCLVTAGVMAVVVSTRRLRKDRVACPNGSWWGPSVPTLALWSWLLVPTLLSFSLTQPWLNLHVYDSFYLVAVAPALALLVAVGVTSLDSRLLSVAVLCALLATSTLGVRTFLANRQRQNLKAVALWVDSRWRAGDGLICASWSCSLGLEYYFRDQAGPDFAVHTDPGHWSWSTGRETTVDADAAVASYVYSHPGVFFVSSPLQGDPLEAVMQGSLMQAWLTRNCTLAQQMEASSSLGDVSARLYAHCSEPAIPDPSLRAQAGLAS